jgi:hypothetical protein
MEVKNYNPPTVQRVCVVCKKEVEEAKCILLYHTDKPPSLVCRVCVNKTRGKPMKWFEWVEVQGKRVAWDEHFSSTAKTEK